MLAECHSPRVTCFFSPEGSLAHALNEDLVRARGNYSAEKDNSNPCFPEVLPGDVLLPLTSVFSLLAGPTFRLDLIQ